MIKIASPIAMAAAILLSSLILVNCEKQDNEDLSIEEPGIHEIIILPEQPGPGDHIEVIEQICGNESEAFVQIEGNQINYKRYMNSLMMMPCIPTTDTTVIGPLGSGRYELVRSMIDLNHQISDSIFLQDTIPFIVSN